MSQAYVLGEDGQFFEVMGEDDEFQTVGAARRLVRPVARPQGAALRLQAPPAWRRAVAPGVDLPGEGMEQLPLFPDSNNGVFSSTVTDIVFTSKTQRAFRGERPVVIIGRNGTSASGVLPVARPGFFVGTQIVGAALGDVALDAFGPTAFGVRMSFHQATPGVEIVVPVRLNGLLTPGDTISVAMFIIGRSVR